MSACARFIRQTPAVLALISAVAGAAARAASEQSYLTAVDPFIGTTNGGNTYPGATLPFGMVAFSPEETPLPGRSYPIAAPGGYEWRANGIKGFSLTHLSGTGCTGASGDIPIMPITVPVDDSPSGNDSQTKYASWFNHQQEKASPGFYEVTLGNGVTVSLSATLRSGIARFAWSKDKPDANLLFRTSDSEVGSSDATIQVSPKKREVIGSVTSGNFCGYLSPDRRESYYTLYFVARFDQPFTAGGAWHDLLLTKGARESRGGTGYGSRGHPPGRTGSGASLVFDPVKTPVVNMRVGISYVSLTNARLNLDREQPNGTTLESVHENARKRWESSLSQIAVRGGSDSLRRIFYTALYHVLLEPNTYSDINGEYFGFDRKVHRVVAPQAVQYANFSGWDVYRSQLQLLTWLDPKLGSDVAQSLLNQANQNNGVWDRWTHLTGATSVMNGDPSAPAIASIYAFGGRAFDVRSAYASLLRAATVPTALDLSSRGCPVQCLGQRPGLDRWLKLHYMPVGAPGWGSVADTLEMASADFALSQLALALHDQNTAIIFQQRAGWWRNLFNANASSSGGYIQPRNADGSWKTVDFNIDDDDDYVEGSGAQYLWMVPFDAAGLFTAMGGTAHAKARMDRFFYTSGGKLAVTKAGADHPELANEPSIGAPWLYDFTGSPWKAQQVVRAAIKQIWKDSPDGISGNDDLGEMSSWFIWAALGFYPLYPGRAELVLGSPLFEEATISRPDGDVRINARGAGLDSPFISEMWLDGLPANKPWLPSTFVARGGTLNVILSGAPSTSWGAQPADAPPSFGP